MSTVRKQNASILREKLHNLFTKCVAESVPLADHESGFYSRYFLVLKKDSGLQPILDLRPLNHALSKHSFKIIMLRQILSHIGPCFHIQVVPCHFLRRFLKFAFEGIAYRFPVLPFGLSLAPRTFTKCIDEGECNVHPELS